MDKGEPALVPEWYRAGGASNSSSSNHHHFTSSSSDDQGTGTSSKRLSPSTSDCDLHRSFLTDRTSSSSYRRSRSSNGSSGFDRDSSINPRPYSSFNKGHRERGRERISDYREKKSSGLLDNGLSYYSDVLRVGRSEKDTFLRSNSKAAGRHSESQSKLPGVDANNGAPSAGSLVSGIRKSSFEKDFPTLSAESKQGSLDVKRVPSSTGLNSAVQSLPLGSSVVIGGEGWTSALAEVPAIVGGSRSMLSSVQPSTHTSSLATTSSTSGGLNMAETLAKAPLLSRASPQLSVDTQRLEELAIKQSRQLIPVTPTTPKSPVPNFSERLKSKAIRTGSNTILPKVMPTSQPANYPILGTARSDSFRSQQVGNFQVLNRERKLTSTSTSKVGNPVVASPVSAVPTNSKVKSPVLSVAQSSIPEKRPLSRDRISFFNDIRNGKSANTSTSSQEKFSPVPSSTLEKSDEQTKMANVSVGQPKDSSALDLKKCSLVNSDCGLNGNCTALEEPGRSSEEGDPRDPDMIVPDEEEARFLRSLGWEENADEEALTAEEIDAFLREHNPELSQPRASSSQPSR